MRNRAADLVLLNGKVITVDARFSLASALAIENNVIAAVGHDADIRQRIGPETRVIDLRGRTAMPGLIDGHAHLDREGLKTVFPSLGPVRSISDIQDRIAELARGKKPGEWIVTMPIGDPPYYRDVPDILAEKRFPDRYDIDKAAPDNPVYIRPIWGFWRHTLPLVSIANSRALAEAGITRDTVSPIGFVQIDKQFATGEPTGIFYEWTMMPLVELTLLRRVPGFTHADRVRTLPLAMRAYHAYGTTSIFEEHGVATELLHAYKEVKQRGELTVRATLVHSPHWKSVSGLPIGPLIDAWGGWLGEPALGDDFLKVSGLLLDIGGGAENDLRASASPYTGWAGFNYDTGLARERVKEVALACARNNIRVVGIWSNVLDLYEEVNCETPIVHRRWVLGHISALDSRDVGRVRDLGLVVSAHTNRYILKEGHLLRQRLGPGRENDISPLRALADAGVKVSLATDNVPTSMFYPVHQSIVRRSHYTGEVIAPDQCLTREQALRAATINGAYLTFDEDRKGSLEPGKLADIAVLNADPLTVNEDEIMNIRAEMTFVDGKLVYELAG